MDLPDLYPLVRWDSDLQGWAQPRQASEHTMGNRLRDYVLPKLPMFNALDSVHRVTIRPSVELSLFRVAAKPRTKRFNWLRPSADVDAEGELAVIVPPGRDYLYHYGALFASGISMEGLSAETVVKLPSPSARDEFVNAVVPSGLEGLDIVVVGYVEDLFGGEGSEWIHDGSFGLRTVVYRGTRIGLLGCEFSFWGDMAGALVTVLASRRVTYVIYIGKAGAVSSAHQPNLTVATGNVSTVEGASVSWKSSLAQTDVSGAPVQYAQRHATLPSPMDETLEWYRSALGRYDFLEAEIGHMAAAANAAGIRFDYLHVISDNLGDNQRVGLYGERVPDVVDARRKCLIIIEDTIKRNIAQ